MNDCIYYPSHIEPPTGVFKTEFASQALRRRIQTPDEREASKESKIPIEQLDRYLATVDLCRDLSSGKLRRDPTCTFKPKRELPTVTDHMRRRFVPAARDTLATKFDNYSQGLNVTLPPPRGVHRPLPVESEELENEI